MRKIGKDKRIGINNGKKKVPAIVVLFQLKDRVESTYLSKRKVPLSSYPEIIKIKKTSNQVDTNPSGDIVQTIHFTGL